MLATAEQYAAMHDRAAAGRYAFPAINVMSSQPLNAALSGFAEAGSDGIVQVTVGGARYLSGGARDALAGARALAALGRELAARSPVAIALHTDHCPPEHVDAFLRPLLEASHERAARGEQALFHSHMFDGSTLPLEDNLHRSAELLARCRELDVLLRRFADFFWRRPDRLRRGSASDG
jgi:fructose-bisphosphate aldolase, class II